MLTKRLNMINLRRKKHCGKSLCAISLFDDESETTTTQDTTQTTDSTRTSSSTLTGESTQSGTSTTTLLSDDVQKALEDLILNTADIGDKNSNSGQISSIAQTLFTRAQGAADDINAQTQAIVADERRIAEKELASIQTQISQDAGGVGVGSSSFVAGATAEGRASLETGLARLQAELGINARNIQTNEFSNAIQAFSSSSGAKATDANAISQLVNVLRGATSTTTTEQQTSQTQQQDINEILNQLIEGSATGTSIGTSSDSLLSSGIAL